METVVLGIVALVVVVLSFALVALTLHRVLPHNSHTMPASDSTDNLSDHSSSARPDLPRRTA
ncbi:MAG TPA: hypothetical protein VN636_18380 [Acidimicrobiia bacterium]|nr:hypothetical protein [Acidimicrobiia bacterium]